MPIDLTNAESLKQHFPAIEGINDQTIWNSIPTIYPQQKNDDLRLQLIRFHHLEENIKKNRSKDDPAFFPGTLSEFGKPDFIATYERLPKEKTDLAKGLRRIYYLLRVEELLKLLPAITITEAASSKPYRAFLAQSRMTSDNARRFFQFVHDVQQQTLKFICAIDTNMHKNVESYFQFPLNNSFPLVKQELTLPVDETSMEQGPKSVFDSSNPYLKDRQKDFNAFFTDLNKQVEAVTETDTTLHASFFEALRITYQLYKKLKDNPDLITTPTYKERLKIFKTFLQDQCLKLMNTPLQNPDIPASHGLRDSKDLPSLFSLRIYLPFRFRF